MNDTTLDQRLSAIAARAEYPATPSLRPKVLAAIADTHRPHAMRTRGPLAFAAAVAAIVLAGAVAAIALPDSRDAVADFFGIEGSTIEFTPSTPGLPPPDDIGSAGAASPSTLAAASDALQSPLPLPADAGEPAAVYIVRYGAQNVAVLRYDEFDLWIARLESQWSFGKDAPPGVTVQDTFVADEPARWISGGTHFVAVLDRFGERIEGSDRAVEANTLIWNDGGTFFRIETQLPLSDARRIAESLP